MPDISSHTKEMVTELENMAKDLQDVEKNGAARQTWIQQFDTMICMLRDSDWSADSWLQVQKMVPELENIEKEIQELEKNDAERQIWIQNFSKPKAVVAAVQPEALALSLEKDGHVIEDPFVNQKDKINQRTLLRRTPLLIPTTQTVRIARSNKATLFESMMRSILPIMFSISTTRMYLRDLYRAQFIHFTILLAVYAVILHHRC
jgi:hypothetical protein